MFGLLVLGFLGIPLSYLLFQARQGPIEENLKYIGLPQTEVTQGGDLLDDQGSLKEVGWAKRLLKNFNSELIPSVEKQFRLKKWDYYQIMNDQFYLGIALVDLGFIQDIQVTFYDMEDQDFIHKDKLLIPFYNDRLNLLDNLVLTSTPRVANFISDDLEFTLQESLEGNKEQRYLNLSMVHKGKHLQADIRMDCQKDEERIVMIQPINGKRNQFFYNAKTYNWAATGSLECKQTLNLLQTSKVDGFSYDVNYTQTNAGMDFGRGIWNYRTFWMWSTGMGFLSDGQRFGINLGGGFQDNKEAVATEDSLFIGHNLIKLRDLVYDYDLANTDQPFIFKSNNVQRGQFQLKFSWEGEAEVPQKKARYDPLQPGQFYCEFLPVHKNQKTMDVLIVQQSFQQYFGIYSGAYVLPSGQIIEFHDIFGLIEFMKAKW